MSTLFILDIADAVMLGGYCDDGTSCVCGGGVCMTVDDAFNVGPRISR